MSKNVTIQIADVSISISSGDNSNWCIAPSYHPFVSPGKTDIHLCLHQGAPEILVGEAVFDSPPIWTLYRQNGTSIVKIFHDLSDQQRTLVLPPHFEKADLYFTDKAGRFHDPFYGPTMELMINYLAQGRGVIFHACGIERDGKG